MEIHLAHKRLDCAFVLCFLASVLISPFFPAVKLQFFIPFLIIAIYKKNLITCLWLALGCGLLIDLFSSEPRLGLYSLDYCLTMSIIYSQKKNFFADSLTTLPLMAFFFSLLSTVIFVFLNYMMESEAKLCCLWIFTDLLIMPLVDAVFAFSGFILPALLLGKRPKRGKDYFLNR